MGKIRPTRYYSKKQENAVAKAIGGKRTANSGATRFDKGDVRLDDWLIECKTKTQPSQSMSIKKEWLTKNEDEAFGTGKHYSAVCFDFGDGERYYIIKEKNFKEYLELLQEK